MGIRQFVRCRRLFTGLQDHALGDHTVVVEQGEFTYVGPTDQAPQPDQDD